MTSLNSMVFFVEGVKYVKDRESRRLHLSNPVFKYFYSFLLNSPAKTESSKKSQGIHPIAES